MLAVYCVKHQTEILDNVQLKSRNGVKYAVCQLKTYCSLVAASILIAVFSQPVVIGRPQTQDTKHSQIEVRLIPKKKLIKVGEGLEVRVEVWNVGPNPVFIRKDIYELCIPSPLSLLLELGPRPKIQTVTGCAADCIYSAKDSFAARFAHHWTTLPARSFYGTVVSMRTDSFPQLSRLGRWRLRGTYQSLGGLASSVCFDTAPILDNSEQIKGLPYEAWQGSVDTNSVWIEVVRARDPATLKKSP